MHHEFNAFLLLFLILASSLAASAPQRVAASSSPVKFGIRLWNYNTTHVVPNADVSLQNGTLVKAEAFTNSTGWVNLTAPNPGAFTLHIVLKNLPVYNATLLLNQTTTFVNLTSSNVADYSFVFTDNLLRHVENVKVDLTVNSSQISSTISRSNGTAIAKNIPFHSYNLTFSREGVNITKSTARVNSTTYKLNTFVTVPTYTYTLSARDYRGQNIVSSGTAGIYDWVVSTNNATKLLSPQLTFANLWPGTYIIVVTSSNVIIWSSPVIISQNSTQLVNTHTGYSVTIHVFDAINRPIPSVSVNLIQNGVVIATTATDSSGIVAFNNLPDSLFQLNFTLLHRAYTTSANITGASVDMSIKLDDIIILAGAPFNTAPIEASSALILTVAAIMGTILLYRWRKGFSGSSASKSKEESK